MKRNKVIWMLVFSVVLATVAVTMDSTDVDSQEKAAILPNPTPPVSGTDLSKYGVADYDAVFSLEASELERRKRASARYDNEGWVVKYPHPKDFAVGRFTEEIPPPLIPTRESDLIVIGKAVEVTAHLSNDKTGVYSEFTFRISQVMKNSNPLKPKQGSSITFDRPGGVVCYPTGQKVLYEHGQKGMPEVGREYLLFLRTDTTSDNYDVITVYELRDVSTVPLDSGRNVEDIKRMGKSAFVQTVRDELSRPNEMEEPGGRP